MISFTKLINETEENLSSISDKKIKNIIDVLKSNKLPTNIIDKIYALSQFNSENVDIIVNTLKNINVSSADIQLIIETSVQMGCFKEFSEYIVDKKININDVNNKYLTNVFAKYNLPKKFILWLINQEGYRVGKGELALIVLINKASNAGKGDVNIDNKHVEVKGTGGRMLSTRGFGNGLSAARTFEKEYKQLAGKHNININIPAAGGNDYNLTGNNWQCEIIGHELITQSNGKIKINDIIKVWKSAFEDVYYNMNLSWMEKHFNNDGTLKNRKAFLIDWAKQSFEYYKKTDKFDLFVIIDSKTSKCGVINNADELIKTARFSVPSFSSKASIQGSVFKVTLK